MTDTWRSVGGIIADMLSGRLHTHKEKYQEYLRSPEWREKRSRVMRRASYLCEMCGERRATEVHHLTYDRIFREELDDLKAICRECHKTIHDKEE